MTSPPSPPIPPSPPSTSFPSSSFQTSSQTQRRRSSAAHIRPAGPPPNLPIPSIPQHASPPPPFFLQDAQEDQETYSYIGFQSRTSRLVGSMGRIGASPSLAAVTAFGQSRNASSVSPQPPSTTSVEDLSDPPPQSILSPNSGLRPSFDRPELISSDRLVPPESQSRPEPRPSSRRTLTRALELAREAVQLDSMNTNPEAAVQAYGRSVALLSEVMDRVRRGDDTSESHRRRRRRSIAAQEEEIRRLQLIHDTYADRMNILSIIYSIPTVPYSTNSLYSLSNNTSTDSAHSNSPTSASPVSDISDAIPPPINGKESHYPDDYLQHIPDENDRITSEDPLFMLIDSTGPRGGLISGLSPPSHHPYALPYDPPQVVPSVPPPTSQPQPSATSIPPGRPAVRRSRAPSNLPPALPHPTISPPPTPVPVVVEPLPPPLSSDGSRRLEVSITRPRGNSIGHKRGGSGSGRLTALEEESERFEESQFEDYPFNGVRNQSSIHLAPDTPRNIKPNAPPLPPLPSTSPSGIQLPFREQSPAAKLPPSPRLSAFSASLRTRGLSQSQSQPQQSIPPPPPPPPQHQDSNGGGSPIINTTPAQGTISQRRITKTSAPPTPRSLSPVDSTASIGSVPMKIPSTSLPGPPAPASAPTGRNRSNSQPGRRPTLVGGRTSPLDLQGRPPGPLPTNGITSRRPSNPSKLNPDTPSQLFVQTDLHPLTNGLIAPPPAATTHVATTPSSPLPPVAPTEPVRKPYHMMQLLRITMENTSGGYISRRLHVPKEVWSQGGAKLSNVADKVRIVGVLCGALEELEKSSAEYFGAGNVSIGLALGIGSIGKSEGSAWLSRLDDWLSVCDGVVADFGKKLGVGEGFMKKATSGWKNQLTRRLDKFTNGKNLDSPDAYVQGLRRLFHHAQLLEEHTVAVFSYPPAPAYASFPPEVRSAAETRLKRSSEFFANVVLQFVIQDLGMLLVKYTKKCERWLEE